MKITKFLLNAFCLVLTVFAIVSVLGPDIMAQVPIFDQDTINFIFSTGSGIALANVVGTPGGEINTGTTTDDRLVRDVDQKITEHKPDRFRLDTALRRIKSAKLEAKYAEWEEVGQYPRIASIDDTSDLASAATIEIPLSTSGGAAYFKKHDICRIVDTATGIDHTNFTLVRCRVTAINTGTNTVTVRAYGTSGFVNVPAIPANTDSLQLIRFGHAKSEKDGVGEPRSMEPVQIKNYLHTNEEYVSISKLRKNFKTYTENDLKRTIRQAMYDFRLNWESIFWDGVGMESTDPDNSEKIFAMKGISQLVTSNVISLPAVGSITETMFLDWAQKVSDDSHGSDEKMLWVSADLWTEINKIPLIQETLQSRRNEKVLGAYVTRIQAGHCDLLVGVHKGFKELGKTRFGAIIDPMHIRKRVVEPLERVIIDPENSGGPRVEGVKFIETCTVEIRYEKTHALLV